MPAKCSKFSTEDFKIVLNNNYLRLLNDIYSTRLSNGAFRNILNRLEKIKDFGVYEIVLAQFHKCNPKKNGNANAFSFGTKVLHTYNPEENPILDSVVRENLGIGKMNLDFCLDFKKAMNCFVNKHEEYFSCVNQCRVKDVFREFHLKPDFPKMKLLDMAIMYRPLPQRS